MLGFRPSCLSQGALGHCQVTFKFTLLFYFIVCLRVSLGHTLVKKLFMNGSPTALHLRHDSTHVTTIHNVDY